MSKHLYVVGIDGSEWGERAAIRAANLAKQTGAHLKLVYVMNWSAVQPMMMEGVAPPVLSQSEEEEIVNTNVIAPLTEQLNAIGAKFECELIWGDPVEILSEKVKEAHAHFLFVGRRGRSRIADLVLGSVANKLAHYVGIPIVLVP